MSKIALILIPIAFIAASCNVYNNQKTVVQTPVKNILTIGNAKLNVEVASSIFDREKGLSGRASLAEFEGMLFVFPEADRHSFWMKGMNFPLDFIWIKDGKVTEITRDVPHQPNVPDSQLKSYLPAEPIDSMLEVNAGWSVRNGIKVGDSVNLTSQ